MAIEKAKVLAALQLKFKGKSVSKTFIEKLATRYAEKIETDADMDDYINDRMDDILDGAAEADRRVQAATSKPIPKPGDKPEVVVEEDDDLKDATPVERALLKQIKELSTKVTGFETQQTAKTLEQRFDAHESLKGIPKTLFKGRYPKTEEEFEAAVTEAAEDLKSFVVTDGAAGGKKGFGDRPGAGGTGGAQQPTATKVTDAVKDFADSLKAKSAAVAQTK